MKFNILDCGLRAFGVGAAFVLAASVLQTAHAASPESADFGPNDSQVQWAGTATGGASANVDTCVYGVSCDRFIVNVTGAESEWDNKLINVAIEWTVPASDYDLKIYKIEGGERGAEVGSAGDGAPETIEEAAINPSSDGVGQYEVVAIYFAVPPGDQYTGTLRVTTPLVSRSANYVGADIEFASNVPVAAPVAARDGEPSLRVDVCGNAYVGAIRGVPAGVDLWYFDLNPDSPTFDPLMRNPIYRGQPDSFTQDEAFSVGADGGGDIDLAVGFMNPADCDTKTPKLAYSSLVAANISTGRSLNKGETFELNPVGNVTGGPPGDDRQWHEFHGEDTVYLLYRTLAPAVAQVQRSNDGGFTYGPTSPIGTIGQVGSVDVHQASGTVYASGGSATSGTVCAATPTEAQEMAGLPPTDWYCNGPVTDPNGMRNIFFVVKVADDGTENGTAYVTYSNGSDIMLTHSTDKGRSWSSPVRVNNGEETRTSVFPWLETGPTPGSVGIVWFGTSNPTNSDAADWEVFYALSYDADATNPTFQQAKVSDHFIHGSNISVGGTLGNANRNLIDYFQIGFDPLGAAVIAYTDDHNDFDGHTYVTRQISGPSIYLGSDVPAPLEGAGLPPAAAFDANAPEVTDFAQDVASGLLVRLPQDDPLDILSIDYSCEDDTTDGLTLIAEMLVSDLSVVVPESNYRVNFTANAPQSEISPTGLYSFGVSDRGDQFYIRVTTGADGTPGTTWGTAERQSDGTIAYTPRGAAESSIDTDTETVTLKVPVSELNAVLPLEATPVGEGTVLAGLRGQTFTSGANAKRDLTRGGTQYTLGNCDGDDGNNGGGGGGGENDAPIIKVTGGGKIDGKNATFGFNADHAPGGHLNFKDNAEDMHLVSDSIDTFVADNAKNQVTFTGTGRIGNDFVTFLVTVTDNGEPGRDDTFHIELSNGYSKVGTLTNGNIQVHR